MLADTDWPRSVTECPAATPLVSDLLPHSVPSRISRPYARWIVEDLVLLLIALVIIRAYLAEAFVIPSGSMASTLVGIHEEILCTHCKMVFAYGLDGKRWEVGHPVCLNCGSPGTIGSRINTEDGDRVLVFKPTYHFREPRRWEVGAFSSREENGQPFVKRIVGLPGEVIELKDGDIFIDGKMARKELSDVRAVRTLVYDYDFVPEDYAFAPRWIYKREAPTTYGEGLNWQPTAGGFTAKAEKPEIQQIEWLVYRHWQPDRDMAGPVRDFLAYNGTGWGGDYQVRDLMLAFDAAVPEGERGIWLSLGSPSERIEVELRVGKGSVTQVTYNGMPLVVSSGPGKILASSPNRLRFVRIEASFFDRRLIVAVNGQLLFDPVDFPVPEKSVSHPASEVAIGFNGLWAEIRHLQVYRDVYYTPQLSGSFQPGFGIGRPYKLGMGEFFVLGDNSPVSKDSRFWSTGAVVRREDFLGKPSLVYFPGRHFPLLIPGIGACWVPDFREIRYIQ